MIKIPSKRHHLSANLSFSDVENISFTTSKLLTWFQKGRSLLSPDRYPQMYSETLIWLGLIQKIRHLFTQNCWKECLPSNLSLSGTLTFSGSLRLKRNKVNLFGSRWTLRCDRHCLTSCVYRHTHLSHVGFSDEFLYTLLPSNIFKVTMIQEFTVMRLSMAKLEKSQKAFRII